MRLRSAKCPSTIEIKTIPAAKRILTEESGNYFYHNNMFMRLFRYLSDNDLSMTVPIEAQIEKAKMKFMGAALTAQKL